MSKSLLLVSESYWPTIDGGAILEHGLAHALKSRGWHVYVWSPSPTGTFYVEDDSGVTTIREASEPFGLIPDTRSVSFLFSTCGGFFASPIHT